MCSAIVWNSHNTHLCPAWHFNYQLVLKHLLQLMKLFQHNWWVLMHDSSHGNQLALFRFFFPLSNKEGLHCPQPVVWGLQFWKLAFHSTPPLSLRVCSEKPHRRCQPVTAKLSQQRSRLQGAEDFNLEINRSKPSRGLNKNWFDPEDPEFKKLFKVASANDYPSGNHDANVLRAVPHPWLHQALSYAQLRNEKINVK